MGVCDFRMPPSIAQLAAVFDHLAEMLNRERNRALTVSAGGSPHRAMTDEYTKRDIAGLTLLSPQLGTKQLNCPAFLIAFA